jgi:hypothetical protein
MPLINIPQFITHFSKHLIPEIIDPQIQLIFQKFTFQSLQPEFFLSVSSLQLKNHER